jgi:hypothetical protein
MWSVNERRPSRERVTCLVCETREPPARHPRALPLRVGGLAFLDPDSDGPPHVAFSERGRRPKANLARHLLHEHSVHRDALPEECDGADDGLVAPLGRPVKGCDLRRSGGGTRRGSQGWRCVAVLLALGLGLSGVSACLCAAEPGQTSDLHACCGPLAGHGGGVPTSGTSVTASSTPCCASQTAAGFAARLDDRDVLRRTVVAAVATAMAPQRYVAPSTVGASATCHQSVSPPRTTVLRL